jgi:hypothetical protein
MGWWSRCATWRAVGTAMASLLLIACVASGTARAAHSHQWSGYNTAEQWVLTQMAGGRYTIDTSGADTVDLRHAPTRARASTLGARFLENLLTGAIPGFRVGRHGVAISNAEIVGSIDLEYATVPYPVHLTNCRFQGKVDLGHSIFSHDLSLDGSTFQQILVMDDATVGTNPVDGFSAAGGATFASNARFSAMAVAGYVSFANSTFNGWVRLDSARIGSYLDADGATFAESANFNGISVAGNVSLRKTVSRQHTRYARFDGPADFTTASVGGQFNAKDAWFADQSAWLSEGYQYTVSFNTMNVAGMVFLMARILPVR